MVTVGADAVVTVWTVTYAKSNVTVEQRTSLFGHRAPVTSVVCSKAYSTLVSCDADGRVLMWDLNRCEFVREIVKRGHEVGAARICTSTGDVALAVGRKVAVYSLNGRMFAERDVCERERDEVTCLAWYDRAKGEWSRRNLLFTGHLNGVVKVSRFAPEVGDSKLTIYRFGTKPFLRMATGHSSLSSALNFLLSKIETMQRRPWLCCRVRRMSL